MMRIKGLALMVIMVGLAACGSSEPKLTATGTWTGSVGQQAFTLHLAQSGASVTGDATISNTGIGTAALTVAGTFNAPTFTATLTSSVLQPVSISATETDASTMIGSLNGSGFVNTAITLSRQR